MAAVIEAQPQRAVSGLAPSSTCGSIACPIDIIDIDEVASALECACGVIDDVVLEHYGGCMPQVTACISRRAEMANLGWTPAGPQRLPGLDPSSRATKKTQRDSMVGVRGVVLSRQCVCAKKLSESAGARVIAPTFNVRSAELYPSMSVGASEVGIKRVIEKHRTVVSYVGRCPQPPRDYSGIAEEAAILPYLLELLARLASPRLRRGSRFGQCGA